MTEKSSETSFKAMLSLSLLDIKEATQGAFFRQDPCQNEKKIARIVIDSRETLPGDLFAALPGARTDGHLFVKSALEKGAVGCLVSKPVSDVPQEKLIIVPDCQKALMDLGRWFRKKIPIPVIGITGSSGKSTAKEMTALLLNLEFPVLKSPGSYNNELGVPLTLLSWEKNMKAIVLEMAMRGKGQIAELCEISSPAAGMITSIGDAHIGLLGSKKNIADAKGELLEALPMNGLAFLPYEDEWTDYLKQKCRCEVRTFGISKNAWLHLDSFEETWEGTKGSFVSPLGKTDFFLPVLGKHNLINFLGAASTALSFGVPIKKIPLGALQFRPLHGRFEVHKTKSGMIVVDDSYNANSSSLSAGLETISKLPSEGRKILVLGDMLELGEFGEKAHKEAGEKLLAYRFNALFALGELSEKTAAEAKKQGIGAAFHFRSHEELIQKLARFAQKGDVILIKGSRKMEMEKVLPFLTSEDNLDRHLLLEEPIQSHDKDP